MRKLHLTGSTDKLTQQQMWERIINVLDYPKFVKYCKSVKVGKMEKGGGYEDVTTLLWIPVKAGHTITEITPPERIHYDLKLPFGATMQMKFMLKPNTKGTELTAIIDFDLGNRLYNYTLGHFLEERQHVMLRGVFPEITNYVRLH